MSRRPVRFAMSSAAYLTVAAVIRAIADPAMRQAVADHFATEFNKRSVAFDPFAWCRATGGKVAPNSAAAFRSSVMRPDEATAMLNPDD